MVAVENKIILLKGMIEKLGKVAVAFSGGKDSFYLIKIAIEVLSKENVKIIFADSDFIAENDRKRLEYFEEKYDLDIIRIEMKMLDNREIRKNPENRCYICKSIIFGNIIKESKTLGIEFVLDGTTFSDLDEYRPGLIALEELKIMSPLRDAKINSGEIIKLLEKKNIDDYYLTSSTCLATRFPYNSDLSEKEIRKFDRIEKFLVDNDIYPVRVRYIEGGIRIEAEEENVNKILEIKNELINLSKNQGIGFITLDLEGLKSGVWDKKTENY